MPLMIRCCCLEHWKFSLRFGRHYEPRSASATPNPHPQSASSDMMAISIYILLLLAGVAAVVENGWSGFGTTGIGTRTRLSLVTRSLRLRCEQLAKHTPNSKLKLVPSFWPGQEPLSRQLTMAGESRCSREPGIRY